MSGYPIVPGRATAGNARMGIDVWVADTWYGWQEVARFPAPLAFVDGGHPRYALRRSRAEDACATLNAEHDAWLRAG
jgi:hypothetical protein